MSTGVIGKPLARKQYLIRSMIVYVIGFVLLFTSLEGIGIAGLLLIPVLAYLVVIRIRRIVDIGFSSWVSAGVALLSYGALAYFVSRFSPISQVVITIIFEVALLITPTGANIRKDNSSFQRH